MECHTTRRSSGSSAAQMRRICAEPNSSETALFLPSEPLLPQYSYTLRSNQYPVIGLLDVSNQLAGTHAPKFTSDCGKDNLQQPKTYKYPSSHQASEARRTFSHVEMPLLHHQPFKFLYIVYFALKTLIKLPIWALFSLLPSFRPKASWSVEKCLRVYLLRSVMTFPVKLGLKVGRDLTKEVSDSTLRDGKFAWVEGVTQDVLTGEIQEFAEKSGVKPAKIPGYWQLKRGHKGEWTPKAREREKVVYHLHGGAFWLGTAHPSDVTARIPRGILEHSETVWRTFAVDYRLSASAPFKAKNAFPAALLDCIAGYEYLIGLGFRAENIVVAGDSAGGNLALGLTRYVVENPSTGLSKPGKLVLFSPWGDLSTSRTGPGSSRTRNRKTDIFPVGRPKGADFGAYGVTSYIGSGIERGEIGTNRYLSPTSAELAEGMFQEFPRTYIVAGGDEMILDDAEVIAERMKKDNGGEEGRVTLDVVADGVHDLCIFPWDERERKEVLGRVGRWIDEEMA